MGQAAKRKLLVVDDDPGIQRSLRWAFEDYEVVQATDRIQALNLFQKHAPDVVTLDLGLPPAVDSAEEGLKALRSMLDERPETKVIVVSGNEDTANAVAAVADGAYDFYAKPIDAEVLGLIVQRAFHVFDLEEQNRRLQREKRTDGKLGLVTADAEMLRICRLVEKVAPSRASVLLLGESGVGKELFARALHDLSDRAAGPFVPINCAAIPDQLLESELFGHEKGAFTGAVKTTKGKLEVANRGTVFLDEIGDMPAALQAKLLRVLQERVIERIGGRDSIPIDIRVVCATHQNLQDMIADSAFREDLYFRIGEISVRIPPLRERAEDVGLLARHFLDKHAERERSRAKRLSPEAE
ncbi:MAG: PEP-CTERM-box response regulator transcription factor, partial [Pseudomonadota bacterium]